jgi:hypothetical protein
MNAFGASTRVIAPVGVSHASDNASPLLNQLLRNVVPQKFDNCAEKFADWKWEFDRTCDRLAQGRELDEKTKTLILETALPENLLQEFKLLQKTQNLTYTGFIAKMNERFGRGQPMLARKRLERVELPGSGRIKTQDLKMFEIEFIDAMKNIKDMTLEEARRMLLCKFPDWIRIWVVEEENERTNHNPVILFGGLPGMSEENAREAITGFIGEGPTAVQLQAPGKFLTRFRNLEVARKLLQLQGRHFLNTSVSLTAEIQEAKMSIPDIFTFVFDRLTVREMGTECYSNKDTYRHQSRNLKKVERETAQVENRPSGGGNRIRRPLERIRIRRAARGRARPRHLRRSARIRMTEAGSRFPIAGAAVRASLKGRERGRARERARETAVAAARVAARSRATSRMPHSMGGNAAPPQGGGNGQA